jgi:small-conductance mechanosensitive channel
MDLREVTGIIAHCVLAVWWLWIISSTAPQLRKGCRDRRLKVKILALKSAGFLLTALVVGVIHYWATHWWHVAVCVPVAVVLGLLLRRSYRRTVAAPRHRLTFARRHSSVRVRVRRRDGAGPAHLRADSTVLGPATLTG